ncbi:Pectinesterase 3 [Bienertia sinuspersici]
MKLLYLGIVSSLLILATSIRVSHGIRSSPPQNDNINNSHYSTLTLETHTILKTSCSSTRYPDLCYSAIASAPSSATITKISTHKDVIAASLNLTTQAVEHNYFTVEKLIKTRKNLTVREKNALHDCLEHVREVLERGQVHVEKMCSNALAMIKNMTDIDIAAASSATYDDDNTTTNWPRWMSSGDKRMLQEGPTKADAVVAADGSGDHRTIAEAVKAAPEKSKKRYVIRIKAGVYKENVDVGKKKMNLMFIGEGRTKTIITGNKNVIDGSTTFHSATVAINGEGFLARDLTFQNTAGPSKHQAVALRVGGDFAAFYQCDILAYQDTLYVHKSRQFYIKCLIAGTVDFIFGNAAVVFQDCDIHARKPNKNQKNMITAQSRKDPNQNTGIVIQKCRIGATSDLLANKDSFPTYLGRPWKEYARTVIMQSSISDVVHSAGWHEWDGEFALKTLDYAEYKNNGPGAETSKRVRWNGVRVISDDGEAELFTPGNFITGGSWLASTTFPFSLGL